MDKDGRELRICRVELALIELRIEEKRGESDGFIGSML